MEYKRIEIKEDFIKLDSALKFAGLLPTGGVANMVILEGQVKVNGEGCLHRGKKLRHGDKVEFDGQGFEIV